MLNNFDVKKRWAVVRFQAPGFHCYPDAPAEVKYLKSPHRHLFYIEVTIELFNDDRDIEYHIFNKQVRKFWGEPDQDFESQSCEMLASALRTKVCSFYPNRQIKVSVFEDGENGAIVE
jgi:hypothetical protein